MGLTSPPSNSLPLPLPPIVPPSLPPFPALPAGEEQQPQRGEDYDLSGWARALSNSPRLYPTSYGTTSFGLETGQGVGIGGSNGIGNHSSGFGSYKGLGEASPMLEPRRDSAVSSYSVGNGLSPMLGPTHIGGGMGSMMAGGGFDYSYNSGGAYQHHSTASTSSHRHYSPPVRVQHSPHSHALTTSHSNPGSSHSFSNLERHRSMSPQTLPPPVTHNSVSRLPEPQLSPPPPLNLANDSIIPTNIEKPTTTTANTSPLSELTERRMSSTSLLAADEDPRIRAYAKLEFPTFDMYIQKLSVIIGRRPAVVIPPVVTNSALVSPVVQSAALSVDAVKATEVKLEDFVIGFEPSHGAEAVSSVAAKLDEVVGVLERFVKSEVDVPLLSLTPSSQPGSPTNRTTLLDLSPSAGSTPVLSASTLPPKIETTTTSITADIDPTIASLSLIDSIPTPSEILAPPLANVPDVVPVVEEVAPVITTDIDLGPIRAVSRQHARLYFDYELGGWAIEVLGRNGVVVEGTWKAKGEKESLGRR
jgi:hypothetical protein